MRQHDIFLSSFSILLLRRVSCFRRLSLLLLFPSSRSSFFLLSSTFSSLRECLPSGELCDKFVRGRFLQLIR